MPDRRPTQTDPWPRPTPGPGFAEAPLAAFVYDQTPPPSGNTLLLRPAIDPVAEAPDPRLLARFGAARALRSGVLPWRHSDGATVILAASPQDFACNQRALAAHYGPALRPLPCPRGTIQSALLTHAGQDIALSAAHRTDALDSCRSLDRLTLNLWLVGGGAALGLTSFLQPALVLAGLLILAALTLLALCLLKLAAAAAALGAPPAAIPPALDDDDLPVITVLIALYREADIAPRLIRRLSALDYPRHRLDVILLVEQADDETRAALARAALPDWMRVLAVPPGPVRTKPRALNFGLDLARGAIVGVYDAEDAPAPDQLRKVAATFAASPPDTACLQGVLDFYNPRTNWIARCFTMDYAAWFRLILPGLDRLGVPIPLGGTTVFLRRDVLAGIGGWDAHNVTEDADLGLRLARRGWKTRILPSATLEEANCHPIPWVRQRSRWTKGYLMTWFVHMRRPRDLWRDLGPWRFLALQVLFPASVLQMLLAPFLWSLWLIPLGLDHPADDILPAWCSPAIASLFLAAQALQAALTVAALRRTGHRRLWPWLPLLTPYFMLATFAAVKALVETVICPFHWDKTKHGQFDAAA